MIPSELSLTDVAYLTGLPLHVVRYRARVGALQTFRPTGNPIGKRKVYLSELRRSFPDQWESIIERLSLMRSTGAGERNHEQERGRSCKTGSRRAFSATSKPANRSR